MEFNKSAFQTIPLSKSTEHRRNDNLESIKLEVNIEDFSEEADMIETLRDMKGDDNWAEVRSEDGFELTERVYSFGTRKVYAPKDTAANKNLQSSRGIGFDSDETIEKTLKKFTKFTNEIEESNQLRIDEIHAIVEKLTSSLEDFSDGADPDVVLALYKAFKNRGNKFVELGFRVPSLMNYWKSNGYSEVVGYDINDLSISVCKKMGWDVRYGDLSQDDNFDLSNAGLVVAYHVLEHLTDPLETLKMLNNTADPGTLFHFEIPIEPGIPRLRYGHLYAFENSDLQLMLVEAGFIPVSYSNIPHSGGPQIERILAVSK